MASPACILGSFVLLLAAAPVSAVAGSDQAPAGSTSQEFARVRSGNARLTALIAEATMGSATFKALIASIEATDGIVFVEEGRCGRGVSSCLTWRVTVAGPYRMLFVLVAPGRSDTDVIAAAGHELRHALEVLDDPSLRSTAAIQLFYMRGMSPEAPRAVETAAAVAAGHAVFRDIQRSRSRAKK